MSSSLRCIVCCSVKDDAKAVHWFPQDPLKLYAWRTALNISRITCVNPGDGVCSQHFSNESYQTMPTTRLNKANDHPVHRWRLLPDATPTLEVVYLRQWTKFENNELSASDKSVNEILQCISFYDFNNKSTYVNNNLLGRTKTVGIQTNMIKVEKGFKETAAQCFVKKSTRFVSTS